MEFANRSPGAPSQHHGSSCPYLAQAQNRPTPQSESFHGHAFGWGLGGQHQPAPYHQWSAPPPAAMEFSPPSQLRVPPTSSLDPYSIISTHLPPPQQHQPPSSFRNTDVAYRASGGVSSGHPQPPAAGSIAGTRFHHTHLHNSASPGQVAASHSSGIQSAPHLPPSLQSQEQTQPAASSHPLSHPNQTSQNPQTYSHNQPNQSASQQPLSGDNFSTSPVDSAPSLLSQQHQQLHQQQYHRPMSSSNAGESDAVPPQPGRTPQVEPSGQYQNMSGQAAREQRQQRQSQSQSQNSQSNRHHRPIDTDEAYSSLATQSMNIPPHIPSLLNPSNLQHQYGHDYQSAYSENIPPPPVIQRDLPRLAPPSVPPTFADSRRRTPSSRSTRRSGTHGVPLPPERDRDVDDESSPASSPGSSIDHAIHAAHMRHGPNDRQLRAAQIFRGSVTSRKVASSTAISALESVDVDSLSAAERSCIICYNDFGTETPEGVREAPLRLPRCKHVFGDHCIKKWFEESDSCPYCRTKVPSDTRLVADSRAFMEFMRARGQPIPPELNDHISHEAILRLVASPGASGYDIPSGTRRSPPSESGEHRRRMRPRHSAAMSSSRGDGPAGASTRPLSFSSFPSSSNHSPPSRERYPVGEIPPPLRAHDREREWTATHLPRASARQSQHRTSSNMYHPYSWDESSLLDSSSRLPIPPAGGLPPMPGFPAQHPRQHGSLQRPAPTTQAGPYTHSMELRSQREAGTRSFNPSTSGFNPSERTAPSMDVDIPMPDRDTAS